MPLTNRAFNSWSKMVLRYGKIHFRLGIVQLLKITQTYSNIHTCTQADYWVLLRRLLFFLLRRRQKRNIRREKCLINQPVLKEYPLKMRTDSKPQTFLNVKTSLILIHNIQQVACNSHVHFSVGICSMCMCACIVFEYLFGRINSLAFDTYWLLSIWNKKNNECSIINTDYGSIEYSIKQSGCFIFQQVDYKLKLSKEQLCAEVKVWLRHNLCLSFSMW